MTIGKNSIIHIMDPEKKNKAIFCNGNRAILVSLLYAVDREPRLSVSRFYEVMEIKTSHEYKKLCIRKH